MLRCHNALINDTLRRSESIGAFLSGIRNNLLLEYRRRCWREVAYDLETHKEPTVAPGADLLEVRSAIDAALEQLAPRDRRILREFYLEEKGRHEVCRDADLTDRPASRNRASGQRAIPADIFRRPET